MRALEINRNENMDTLLKLLENDKTWTVISALAGAVAAIAALVTVSRMRSGWREERASKRPYFQVSKPGIKPLENSPPYRMMITFDNTGINPASDLKIKIILLDASLATQPEHNFDFSIANDIPPNNPTPWYTDSVILPNNLPAQYVVVAIKYHDPKLDSDFSQTFFMKWNGIDNGVTNPDFVHASVEEKDKVALYLQEVLNKFLTS